jgi:tRNA threonylcarbamoyladenosine biosynthesis protein TsaE
MIIEVKNEQETSELGRRIGDALRGGEVIELTGDIGAGKTTLVKGIALGLNVDQYVQSPSFTINRVYKGRDGISMSHYDFYRLEDAGIMADELSEVIDDKKTVVVIEWGGVVNGVLPKDRLVVRIKAIGESARRFEINSGGDHSKAVLDGLMA